MLYRMIDRILGFGRFTKQRIGVLYATCIHHSILAFGIIPIIWREILFLWYENIGIWLSYNLEIG